MNLTVLELPGPFGAMHAALAPEGVVRLHLCGDSLESFTAFVAEHHRAGVTAAASDGGLGLAAQLQEYFAGARRTFTVPLVIQGPKFHERVWRELMNVPYGETVSYQGLATRAGNPSAARSVGGAMASNPLPILVPCHRVIRADGGLGGYTGGLHIKEFLLALERGTKADRP